jgi:hypothetical protein
VNAPAVAVIVAAGTTSVLTAQRLRPAPCVQANLNVPDSNSRASSGPPCQRDRQRELRLLPAGQIADPLAQRVLRDEGDRLERAPRARGHAADQPPGMASVQSRNAHFPRYRLPSAKVSMAFMVG